MAKIVLKKRVDSEVQKPLLDQCKEFLKNFLSGGPIVRNNVYRESDGQKLPWEEVKQAFIELHGREYVQNGEVFWRIMPD